MIYDKLSVGLLGLLATEEADATNAQIARYVLAHAAELDDLSVKELASASNERQDAARHLKAASWGFARLFQVLEKPARAALSTYY